MEESDPGESRRDDARGHLRGLASRNGLEERLGYRFRDPDLLERALTHPSALHGADGTALSSLSYERLEFLGDAVIELVVREALLREHPEEDEGRLSRRKADIVSSANLQRRAIGSGLSAFIETGPSLALGEDPSQGGSVLADVLEALAGAVYLDGGLESAREVIEEKILEPARLAREISPDSDPKSRLQELCVANYGMLPRYSIVSREGPDHQPSYSAVVFLSDRPLGQGVGRTKRQAHQEAARCALERLETED
ncbi:ribonuclease III [Candidatus Fermentibacterales bacterium]|nr:ribonuclease III [Candidatus Fermentibacterales bacterium]